MDLEYTLTCAKALDSADELSSYREKFHIPVINGKQVLYFTGNSLGLQPKTTRALIDVELEDWKNWGVEGHFKARNPWYSYHEMLLEPTARLVGAKKDEVCIMNGLTANLHFLMVSFYRPTPSRYKILCEAKAFPSDQYAIESQVKHHGYDPDDAILEIQPREGVETINHGDIYAAIKEAGDSLALIMIGGVNYYTGQLFDMEQITKAGHEVGANVGFDLAHAAGNIKLNLHDWDVDFAAWCSYKYLNSGPGSVAGIYINQKHCKNPELPRFAGWWGHQKATRFRMEKGFIPMLTAESWQLSNAPVLIMAAYKASLDIFDEVGMDRLCEKRDTLTAYLEFVINEISNKHDNADFELITPRNKNERGAQLSIVTKGYGKELFDKLSKEGVVADWRQPNVIRMAPVPLYNSFEDVYQFGTILEKAIRNEVGETVIS